MERRAVRLCLRPLVRARTVTGKMTPEDVREITCSALFTGLSPRSRLRKGCGVSGSSEASSARLQLEFVIAVIDGYDGPAKEGAFRFGASMGCH